MIFNEKQDRKQVPLIFSTHLKEVLLKFCSRNWPALPLLMANASNPSTRKNLKTLREKSYNPETVSGVSQRDPSVDCSVKLR
jgi:hypothetical protein